VTKKNAHLSIEQLEKDVWPAPGFTSRLVAKCHALRKIPINDLDPEGIRMLIDQGIGLPFVIPTVLTKLKTNPFLEGDMFEGDVLMAVVKQKDFVLNDAPEMSEPFLDICRRVTNANHSPLSKRNIHLINSVLDDNILAPKTVNKTQ
jgi:hypothetical protein